MSETRKVHVRMSVIVPKDFLLDEVRRLSKCGVEYLLRTAVEDVVACEDSAKHELEHVFLYDKA